MAKVIEPSGGLGGWEDRFYQALVWKNPAGTPAGRDGCQTEGGAGRPVPVTLVKLKIELETERKVMR